MTVQQLVKKVAVFMKLGTNLPLAPFFIFIISELKIKLVALACCSPSNKTMRHAIGRVM
jgi:hypothetical protein